MEAVVFGNITLDVICKPVEDVPRYDSLPFDEVVVAPGGCGSNVAIGLCASGIPTALVGRIGNDDAAYLVNRYWRKVGLDTRYIRRMKGLPTGTSVGLIDRDCQPRFVHTSGANKTLNPNALQVEKYVREGARSLHVGGFFVLPGLMQGNLDAKLAQAHEMGILTSLDVVRSIRMADASLLWACMPHLDIFLCNQTEAGRLTGENDPVQAARMLRAKGAGAVIVKLGAKGCLLAFAEAVETIDGVQPGKVVDTTGAGDAFAAGLIAALLRGKAISDACLTANQAGARAVENLGAVTGWLN
jgi:sugar/nucleoside kinase (ribokinase family)